MYLHPKRTGMAVCGAERLTYSCMLLAIKFYRADLHRRLAVSVGHSRWLIDVCGDEGVFASENGAWGLTLNCASSLIRA